MAFKMKGMSFGNSPVKQKGPVPKSNIGLLETENKDTYVYDGSDLRERINDYEDRIEFIKEDIFNTDKTTPQQKKDLAKLNQELAILRKKRANKKGSTRVEPKQGDMEKYSDLEKYDDDRN
tara:strand:+ start:166 stop:528 length:363 start_codon:yes stop_codon:yes gene_type:complete